MIEIAAFSALGAVGTADLVCVSSRFKIGILSFLDGSPLALSERGEAYLSLIRDRYSIYLVHLWFALGYGWVSFGLSLGYLQTHTGWLFLWLWSVTFRTTSLFAVAIIAEQFLVLILPLMQDERIAFAPCVAAFYERVFELIRVSCPISYSCADVR